MGFARKQKQNNPALAKVSKLASKAMIDFNLISEGDKLAVAVSGGKDSLSLLHVLRDRQKVCPVKFDFEAVHVDFEFEDFNPTDLICYFKEHNFQYHVEKVSALKGEKYEDIDCYRWSKHRRNALFRLVESMGFTKIVFGHHMDDIVETILLNQFYRAEISAMKPRLELFGGKVVIIRPLAYVRERQMVDVALELGIDKMGQSKCAHDDISHRMIIKKMLKDMERINLSIVSNIFHSLQNINEDYLLDIHAVK